MALDEQVTLVNDRDEVIGHKNRSALTTDDQYRIAVVWIEDGKGNVLVQRRSKLKANHPDKWDNAANGVVTIGESYLEAATRELQEEIGVTGLPLRFVKKTYLQKPSGNRWYGWYSLQLNWTVDRFKLDPSEVQYVTWVNKTQLLHDRDAHPEHYMHSSIFWRDLFAAN